MAQPSKRPAGAGVPAADDARLGRPMNVAERVAREIEGEIVRQGWQVGALIGSEADLAERFQVSRPVVREAARILEHRSVAHMRRGPGGGLIVSAPDPTLTAEEAALYLHYRKVTGTQLNEVRNALELSAVRLTADRIDTDGIARLRAVIEYEAQLEPGPGQDSEGRAQLHYAIAELTGNPALELFIRVVSKVITDRYRAGRHALTAFDESCVLDEHRAIVEAICAGDGALAHFHMQHHLAQALTPRQREHRKDDS